MTFPDEFKIRGYHPWTNPDIANVERALEMLLSAERPIILAGGEQSSHLPLQNFNL